MESIKINLTSCPNFRPLEKHVTFEKLNSEKFFRSDCLSKLTEDEIRILEDNNVKKIIDLRLESEIEKTPNPLANNKKFIYYNISLLDNAPFENPDDDVEKRMMEMYYHILEKNGHLIVEVLKKIIEDDDKKVLFHCVEGKDRTGIVSAILLLVAGVSEEEIIMDYQVSFENMRPLYNQWSKSENQDKIISGYGSPSKPDYMQKILKYLRDKYENVEKYLKAKGLNDEEYDKLCKIVSYADTL